jgi:hypothetical protein
MSFVELFTESFKLGIFDKETRKKVAKETDYKKSMYFSWAFTFILNLILGLFLMRTEFTKIEGIVVIILGLAYPIFAYITAKIIYFILFLLKNETRNISKLMNITFRLSFFIGIITAVTILLGDLVLPLLFGGFNTANIGAVLFSQQIGFVNAIYLIITTNIGIYQFVITFSTIGFVFKENSWKLSSIMIGILIFIFILINIVLAMILAFNIGFGGTLK